LVSVRRKLVSRFLASTDAPLTAPPFSSYTSPWIVPVVICAWPQPLGAHNSADTSTKRQQRSFFIVPPDIPSSAGEDFRQLEWKTCGENKLGKSLGQNRGKRQVFDLWKLCSGKDAKNSG